MTCENFTDLLLKWFSVNRRDLPWRSEPRDPYHVWVSEIMLQQTQVKTVVGYFNRWVTKFPGIPTLAGASLEEVLKAWEGLGYYRRARNLHKAAKMVMGTCNGSLPRTVRELRTLPGIGSYTAAAIASLAFGKVVIALDGNIRRVVSRLFVMDREVTQQDAEHILLPQCKYDQAGKLNEALMELGAICCFPSRPLCSACPLGPCCQAYQQDVVDRYPVPKPKKKIPHVKKDAIIILDGGKIFLRKRPENEMLGGMWGIPLAKQDGKRGVNSQGIRLKQVTHTYTHFRITVLPVVLKREEMAEMWECNLKEGRFVFFREISMLPLSTLDHKILKRLDVYLHGSSD